MLRIRRFLIVFIIAMLTPLTVVAQSSDLIDQARYWEQRGRYDLANEAWLKLLRTNPNNAEALAGIAVNEARTGQQAAAQVYLDKLKAAHPNHPSINSIEGTIRQSSITDDQLAKARGLARQRRYAEAIAVYEELFGGLKPAGRLALEYYQTMAGAEGKWEKARKGLTRLKKENPEDPLYALAFAQHLTYKEKSRRRGISNLAELTSVPAIAKQAQDAWRQALIWLDAKPRDESLFIAYYNRFGEDKTVRERLDRLREQMSVEQGGSPAAETPVDPTAPLLQKAFEGLNLGELDVAEINFLEVLSIEPNNSNALGGMGVVRLRQERFDDAENILTRAIQAKPGEGHKWQEALQSATFWATVRRAEALKDDGQNEAALALLQQALAMPNADVSARTTYAALLVEMRRFDEGRAEFNAILAEDPLNMNAIRGLIGLLAMDQKIREALALADSVPADRRPELGNLSPLRAGLLRSEADKARKNKDNALEASLLKEALILDPNSPWIRMDLARNYQRQNRIREANTLIDGLLTSYPRMPDALYIKALLVADQNMWWDSLRLLERIPLASRGPAAQALQRRVWVRYQTQRAGVLSRLGRPEAAMEILREVEAISGREPELLGAMATAWADVGEEGKALRYIREALSRTTDPSVGLRLQYASLLFKLR